MARKTPDTDSSAVPSSSNAKSLNKGSGQKVHLGIPLEVWKMLTCGLSEFLATGLLMFLGCMGTMPGLLADKLTHFQLTITFGFVVAIVLATFGHISGSHINPSVTVAAIIFKHVSIKMGVVYVISQCLGSILGFGLLKLITPCDLFSKGVNPEIGVCSTVPHKGLNWIQAVTAEYLTTAILIMLCCAIWDPKNSKNTDSIPFKFGILVATVALAEGPYTGASMNPARSLGPAVWNNVWTRHWVYWIGPLSAAVSVAFLWRVVFLEVREAPAEDHDLPLTGVSSSNEKPN